MFPSTRAPPDLPITGSVAEARIMPSRARDWFRQAERDLEQARSSQTEARHEWACFLRELPIAVPETLIDQGKVLDNFYVATRYTSGHPEGAPFEHYGPDSKHPGNRLCPCDH
jgi:HEPN domain-containing protein